MLSIKKSNIRNFLKDFYSKNFNLCLIISNFRNVHELPSEHDYYRMKIKLNENAIEDILDMCERTQRMIHHIDNVMTHNGSNVKYNLNQHNNPSKFVSQSISFTIG